MSQIRKNYIYNLIFKLFSILFSVCTVPYLSRVLGAENIGIYSHTNSIVLFAMLFCLIGISNYGNRLIASVREDKIEKSKQFLSLYMMQIICCLITCLLYVLYVVFISKENQLLLFIQLIYLISALFDISWFFFGIEKFKGYIFIGIIEKVICLSFILLFVNNQSDIMNYAFIVSICIFLKNFFLLPFLKNEIMKVSVSSKDVLAHLKPCLILFIPILAVNIYKVVNKVILGSMAGNVELGYFEQADKIINIPLCIINALAIVVFPRMSNLISKGDEELVKYHMERSMNTIMFIVLPIAFGLIAVSNDFIVLLLGNDFIKTSTLLRGFAISSIFVTWACVIQNYYLICKKMDKDYAISVCFGAITNIILNLLLIPNLKSIGAMISSIITEFVVTFLQTFSIRKEIQIKKYLKNIMPYFIKAFIMMLIVMQIDLLNIENIFIKISLQVIVGILIYFVLNKKDLICIIKGNIIETKEFI